MSQPEWVVSDNIRCARCGAQLREAVPILWGEYIPTLEYQVGDEIYWVRDDQGSPLPHLATRTDDICAPNDPPSRSRYNHGNGPLPRVLLIDFIDCDLDTPEVCPQCGLWMDAVGVVVEDNRVKLVKVFEWPELIGLRNSHGALPYASEVRGEQFIPLYWGDDPYVFL